MSHAAPAAGIAASGVFLANGRMVYFWVSVGIVVSHYAVAWLCLLHAKQGFARRVSQLRNDLLHSRTLGKRLAGDNSVSAIEADDVDLLIARLCSGVMDEIPSWALTDIGRIDEVKCLLEAYPDRVDPDAQPTWLCLTGTVLLLACPVLLVIALVMWIH
jgi:hypothetical protein